MSDQEVKEEYKETEGDPVHRGARKAIAYELSLEERVKCSSCIVVDHR